MTDPYVGKLTFFRVYSGKCSTGDGVLNSSTGNKERIGRLVQMHANKREEITEVLAGDIAAGIGFKKVTTGHTLCSLEHPIVLEAMSFPEPVVDVAIEPKSKADEEKMSVALQRLSEEDPTFRVRTDEETSQTVISGMGELHLEVLVDRMLREFNVDANVGKPQVAYRETLRSTLEVEGKFIRQSGGKGQYGHVWLKLEPLPADQGYEFVNGIAGGSVPKEFIPAVDKGIQEASARGILAGYPMVDFIAECFDGSYHSVDSNEASFKMAGILAFKAVTTKCKPVLLEPLDDVEVMTPDEYLGDVMGDLNSRRGQVLGMENRGTTQVVKAHVPLATMFGYATDLRSMTQGRAAFSMELSHYAEVPAHIAQELVAKNKSAAQA